MHMAHYGKRWTSLNFMTTFTVFATHKWFPVKCHCQCHNEQPGMCFGLLLIDGSVSFSQIDALQIQKSLSSLLNLKLLMSQPQQLCWTNDRGYECFWPKSNGQTECSEKKWKRIRAKSSFFHALPYSQKSRVSCQVSHDFLKFWQQGRRKSININMNADKSTGMEEISRHGMWVHAMELPLSLESILYCSEAVALDEITLWSLCECRCWRHVLIHYDPII